MQVCNKPMSQHRALPSLLFPHGTAPADATGGMCVSAWCVYSASCISPPTSAWYWRPQGCPQGGSAREALRWGQLTRDKKETCWRHWTSQQGSTKECWGTTPERQYHCTSPLRPSLASILGCTQRTHVRVSHCRHPLALLPPPPSLHRTKGRTAHAHVRVRRRQPQRHKKALPSSSTTRVQARSVRSLALVDHASHAVHKPPPCT